MRVVGYWSFVVLWTNDSNCHHAVNSELLHGTIILIIKCRISVTSYSQAMSMSGVQTAIRNNRLAFVLEVIQS